MYKKILFLVFTLITGFSFLTACSSDDEEESNKFFQTNSDKEFEKKLMGTSWILAEETVYDNNNQVVAKKNRLNDSITYFLSPENASNPIHMFDHRCVKEYKNQSKEESTWAICNGGFLDIDSHIGQIISFTNSELIISTHKQKIPGWGHEEEGKETVFKRINQDV